MSRPGRSALGRLHARPILAGAAFAALVLLAAPCAANPSEQADPLQAPSFRFAPLPRETVAAWRAEMADAGWMPHGPRGVPEFRPSAEGPFEALPAFSLDLFRPDSLSRLPHPGRPFGLRLGDRNLTDAGLRSLVRFNTLESLHLQIPRDGGAEALASLAALPRLERLTLRFCPATAEHLRAVARFPKLQALGLHELETTNEAIAELAAAKGLRTLSLEGIGVGDRVMPIVARFPALESLHLDETQVTDAGLAPLAGRNLRKLVVPPRAQTALGLEHYLAALAPDAPLGLEDWPVAKELLPAIERIPAKRLATTTFQVDDLSEEALARLAAAPGVEGLRFTGRTPQLTSEELVRALAGAKRLRRLDLGPRRLSVELLERLVALDSIEELGVVDGHAGEVDLSRLRQLPGLRVLRLDRCRPRPHSLNDVAELKSLEELSIEEVAFDDGEAAALALLPRLRTLRLGGRRLTDEAVPYFTAAPALEVVSVGEHSITREAMRRAGFHPDGLAYRRQVQPAAVAEKVLGNRRGPESP